MPPEKPLVYLILGAAGSGRREMLADLITDGLAEGDRSLVLLSDDELGSEADPKLGSVRRWVWMDGIIGTPDDVLGDATHVFFVSDGRRNPVD
jgi:pantothenate kinase-related protein Tda10